MNAHDILRWVIAILFGAFGWWLIVMNFAIVYIWLTRRKHHSWIPLVGGFFAFVGMVLCPLAAVRRLAWVPMVVDVVYCVVVLIVGLLMELYARKKKRDA